MSITNVVGGFTNANVVIDSTQWIYCQFIYLLFIVLSWLASPYIISRFREKYCMFASAAIFFVISFIRVLAPRFMLIPIILFAIGTTILWASAGSYMFMLHNPTKEIPFTGTSFGTFLGLFGFYRLFMVLNSRDTMISSIVIFIIISAILIFLLIEPAKEFEKEHYDVRDIVGSLRAPLLFLTSNRDFLTIIPVMLYLGFSNGYVDLIVYAGEYTFFVYSLIFSCSAFGFGVLSDKIPKFRLLLFIIMASALTSILVIIAYFTNGSVQTGFYYVISITIAFINGGLYSLLYTTVNTMTVIFKTLSASSNGASIFFLITLLIVSLLSLLYLYKFNQNYNNTNNNNIFDEIFKRNTYSNNNNNNTYNNYNNYNNYKIDNNNENDDNNDNNNNNNQNNDINGINNIDDNNDKNNNGNDDFSQINV
ncbi:hypothetical protein DICPUDRAFT_79293 [Dictyostelium purpureum]|uniref:Uncharacterized protein n=1 Tax=Dictyostelium purpureum TaxID=5786 RepID=F0ZM56_DICPU|nr:uncharacterized protein DICPUDRAFT_79293 [Dictyostelium purpureum]EGC34968.1 hypothetical protein DICPUDRAFT_79293 [Dictyostelium purpureum]|eukprot:XP_003288493.1 hypothetical protein DICPUDRAFT_79293 [Dictyostelium purpureum]